MIENDKAVDFSDLQALVIEWGLPTWHERSLKRARSSQEELQAFHAAMLPRLDEIIQFLNQWPLDEIPNKHRALCYTALAVCEVDGAVEIWKQPTLVPAADPSVFRPKQSYYDNEPPDGAVSR